MALTNLLNLPLLFASNAFFPTKYMPSWLQPVVTVNPVSYVADVSRQLLLGSPGMASVWFDFAYLAAFALPLLTIGMVASRRLLTK